MDMTASIIRFGSERQVVDKTFNTLTPMSVTGLADGSSVLTWQEFSANVNEYEIYQQRFRPDGTAVKEPEKVNTYGPHAQELPEVTALPNGGWIVTWQSS